MELGISSLDEENVLKLNVMVSQPFKHKKKKKLWNCIP